MQERDPFGQQSVQTALGRRDVELVYDRVRDLGGSHGAIDPTVPGDSEVPRPSIKTASKQHRDSRIIDRQAMQKQRRWVKKRTYDDTYCDGSNLDP